MGAGDGTDALAALLEQLWPQTDGAVRVTWGDAPPAPGYRCHERYVVLPDRPRARFLVPAGPRAATAASLLRYNRLRDPRTRIARAGAAVALQAGLRRPLGADRMSVWLSPRVGAGQAAEHLLLAHLGELLGAPGVLAGVGVHLPDPNGKPTLQMLSRTGRPLGFAKVGWNAPTRALVDNEAETLRSLAGRAGCLTVPTLLHSGTWRERTIAVVSPLPTGVRRYRSATPPTALPAGDGATSPPVALVRSAYWSSVRAHLEQAPADGEEQDLLTALTRFALRLEARHADLPLVFAPWHGDWVPWNLASHRGRLYAFDWEHYASSVPWGFDLLHWAFQHALVLQGHPAASAAAAVDEAAATAAARGVTLDGTHRTVASLYLLEMALRTLRLKQGGGAWNPRLHPALADVLDARSAA